MEKKKKIRDGAELLRERNTNLRSKERKLVLRTMQSLITIESKSWNAEGY